MKTRVRRLLSAALALHAGIALAVTDTAPAAQAGEITAVPPAEVRHGAVAARVALLAPVGTVARRIALGAPTAAEMAEMPAAKSVVDKGQPLAIGFGRAIAETSRTIALRDLAWTSIAGGSRVARVEIASPGAAALRVAVQLAASVDGLAMRFAGSAPDASAFGAVAASDIAAASAARGQYWTPVLAGDVATLEIEAAAGVALDDVALRIPRISHAVVSGADLLSPLAPIARATGIGAAGSCNIDVACVAASNAAASELAKSVAKLTFVGDDGRPYLCSGTLINDSIGSNTPYLLSADHCLTSAAIAATLNTFWFYAAAACNSNASPPFVHLTGGARMLGRSQDNDWAIVQLNEAPPTGTKFAAWRAEPVAVGTPVVSLHHPEGDLVKISRGQVTGDLELIDELVHANFTEVVWSSGVTEGGSSGALLATLSAGGYYEVRGGLYAGISSCGLPHYPDYFSHLETALPVMRQYLTPDAANPNGVVPAVEFYNRALDHYFLSTNPAEIDNLDSGRTVGWVRTGLRFLVYDRQAAGTSPVCRFYRAPAYGDSHFYSASPQECAQTAAAHPVDWIYESPSVLLCQAARHHDGRVPRGHGGRVPVLQRHDDRPPLYRREGHPRRVGHIAPVDPRRLRHGAVLPHHVRGRAVNQKR